MIKRVLLAVAASVLTMGWLGTAPAAQATTYTACDGVWVVVDYGSLGVGVKTSCADSFTTGTAALRSAGFEPALSDGFVSQIAGQPTKPDLQKHYWSYWHATRKSDGSYASWSYSNAGSNAYHPTKGDAEGWHYVSLSDPASGPSAAPAKNPAVTTATPTATRTATTKATAKPTKKATASASATTSATTKASASPTSPPVHTTAAASPSATPGQSSATEVSEVAADVPSATATDQPGSGSPTGTIAAGLAVIAAVGGLGSWWLVKGRRS